jgi:hypothetical protein
MNDSLLLVARGFHALFKPLDFPSLLVEIEDSDACLKDEVSFESLD